MTKKLRYFCTLLLMAVVGVAWAQSDYSTTETSNVALAAGTNGSACTVNGENGIKVGTSSKGGDMKVTVPAGTAFLHVHAAAWKGVTGLSLNISGATASPASIALTANDGVSNNSPFTLSGNASDYYFVIELSDITAETTLTFTTSIAKRFVIWGVNAEEDGGSGSTLEDNDLALTGAPVALTFDLYDNAEPQVINYTTSSTGAVTIAESDFFETEIDETNQTITVTPLAVTNGEKEVTVSQAADETYKSGSATFTVNITDSTPFEGGDVTFDATVDKGTSPLLKNGITFECDNGVLNNGSEYRLYKYSSTTFTTSQGVITKIVFTGVSGNPASGFAAQNGFTTDGSNGTWEGSAESVTFTASGAQVRATKIVVTVDLNAVPDPAIEADDVNIAYDATQGAITYTITNEVDGGNLTATTQADWITIGTVGETVPFTATANEAAAAREATVTLTYSYGDNQTVTKDVTVTQAAAPVVYTTIPDLFAAATSTATDVNVQFNNWVVTGVSPNGRNVFVTDGTNGFAIYDGSGSLASTYAVGNTLAGLASCKLKLQNGYAQLQDVNAADLTIGTGGSVDFATITMADLAGVNTGALVQYDNLTCSVDDSGTTPKYYLTDGTTTLQVYNSLYADAYSTLVDGKTYNIKGVYQQYNNTKEILPRSTEDIVEVVSEEPSITVSPAEVNATAEKTDGTLAISYENLEISDVTDFEVQYYDVTGAPISSEPEWVAVEVTVGTAGYEVSYIIENNTNSEERTAYFKVMALDNDANEVYSNLVTVTQEGFSSTGSFTFEQTSATAGTLTNEPEGVTAVFNNTYTNNKEQLTKDNSMTLTIKGMPANYKVTGITLTVKNNASKGSGTATVSIGKKEIGTLDVTGLGGTYGDQDVTIIPSFATSDLVINIAATENSVYCKKFTIEYEIMDYVGVTIKEGFSATTFSCDKALDFLNVEGITANIITDENGTTKEVTTVPANTGLYIVGAEGDYEVPFLANEEDAEDMTGNLLVGTISEPVNTKTLEGNYTYYLFGKQNGKEAFFKVGESTPDAKATASAGKAYLAVPGAGNAKEMIVIGGDVTGIESIENGTIVNDNYYTIDGKLVKGQPTQKGIYIVGGRKVVIK